ncbi:MAG: DUF5615 family PIN-like protein [Propionibacteriaceae bacterium]|jgi:hypothetical protein|nr:DUF5615 family PIN-like protein [Propionibacteriaceae bacterium]
MSPSGIRLLLDEHFPPTLARSLSELGVDTVALVADKPQLIGAADVEVLRFAVNDARVVVTEDVSTFPAAVAEVPEHLGVIFCRSQVFQRTPSGLVKIRRALLVLISDPPSGLGSSPVTWWLEPPA